MTSLEDSKFVPEHPRLLRSRQQGLLSQVVYAHLSVNARLMPHCNHLKTITLHKFEDFHQYVIEHDRVVKLPGRYGDMRFPEFTYTGTMAGFFSERRSVLLLSGKKAAVLSLCATTTRVAEFQIDTLHIDMNALQAVLPSVNLVWFKFRQGMIRASALMGANVERTDAFVQSKTGGAISTLSFFFED